MIHVGEAHAVIRRGVRVLHRGGSRIVFVTAVAIRFGCHVVSQVTVGTEIGRNLLSETASD